MTETGTTSLSAPGKQTIGGRYEVYLDQSLGAGGLARVYRGLDLKSRRNVAIKTLREEFQADPESRRRFRQEARMMAFAAHPGLVTIYDLLEQSNESWIVMELVPGRNLKQVVSEDGPLSPTEMVGIVGRIADALSHLHDRKIVHLDIKPQNLILADDGSIKLIDFGLAQSVAPRQDTIGGTAFGTAAYLSPEQGSGAAVDQRTDVYALGCVMFELLTGRPPFEAPEGQDQKQLLITDHLETDPPPPSKVRPDLGLPVWVDDVICRALEKNPEHRFATVRAFANAARAGLEGESGVGIESTQVLPGERRDVPRITWTRGSRRARPDDIVDDTFDENDEVEPGPSIGRRAWIVGGRVARRSRPLHRTIWRLAMVFAIGNLLLATVLLAREGPESLVQRFLSVVPGTTTEVSVDSLNLRDGPGSEYNVLTLLASGEDVEVTGLSESNEQGRWWPVQAEQDGTTYEGWVWAGGLQANEWTGRMSFMQNIVDQVQGARDSVGNGIDTVTGWWPF
jgi:serine/threonine protein kinase